MRRPFCYCLPIQGSCLVWVGQPAPHHRRLVGCSFEGVPPACSLKLALASFCRFHCWAATLEGPGPNNSSSCHSAARAPANCYQEWVTFSNVAARNHLATWMSVWQHASEQLWEGQVQRSGKRSCLVLCCQMVASSSQRNLQGQDRVT